MVINGEDELSRFHSPKASIRQNNDIEGIDVDNQQMKRSQFAYGTTIIIDGTETSLSNTLQVIRIDNNFDTFSGLQMYIAKTGYMNLVKKSKQVQNYVNAMFSTLGNENDVNLQDMIKLKVHVNIAPSLDQVYNMLG